MVEFKNIFDSRAIFSVFLSHEHIHKGAVVHPVHAERPDKIPLHHPERLCQQQGSGCLYRHAVHYIAPEFDREYGVKLFFTHAMLGS